MRKHMRQTGWRPKSGAGDSVGLACEVARILNLISIVFLAGHYYRLGHSINSSSCGHYYRLGHCINSSSCGHQYRRGRGQHRVGWLILECCGLARTHYPRSSYHSVTGSNFLTTFGFFPNISPQVSISHPIVLIEVKHLFWWYQNHYMITECLQLLSEV